MQTKRLRKVGQFSLNEGVGMSKGLFNVTNDILVENTKDKGVSYWFDADTKETYLRCSEAEFVSRAKQSAGNDIPEFLVGQLVSIKSLKTMGLIIGIIEETNGYSYRTDSDGVREAHELNRVHPSLIDNYIELGFSIAPSTLKEIQTLT